MSEAVVLVPQDGTLTFGSGGEMICQVVAGSVVCEQPENVTEAMCNTVIVPGRARWWLDLDFLQDWHAGGISTYLYNNDGNTSIVTFSPSADNTPKWVGTVTLKCAATGGGPANQAARDRIRLPYKAKPTLTVDA